MNHRKNVLALFSVLLLGLCGYGQKSDYVWLSGYEGYPHPIFDTSDNTYFGTSVINFNFNPIQVWLDSLQMNFDKTNTSYCDNNGNLLFYTNGEYIANNLDQIIEGSESLNQGMYWQEWYLTGYRAPQGILAFQNPVNTNQYYLIHSYWGTPANPDDQFINNTFCSLLDMSLNNGLGGMVYTNHSIISDSLGWELAATRHGNGRDWWILTQKRGSACFYRILLDEQGAHLVQPDSECGGAFVTINDFGTSAFSPDGSKFAHFTMETGLSIYDFDRCTGDLSNPIYIPSNIYQDSTWTLVGVAFSSNGRFLYVSATKRMLQYDLTEPDIASSVDTVGIYDGFSSPLNSPFQTLFNTAQIGPDGKIYINCGNSVQFYNVINYPNLKGDSCDFVQHGVLLPSIVIGIPNFPNYRLGALVGSACDTLTGLSEVARAQKESILKVFPNPATDIVTVDYGFTNWSVPGIVSLVIVNELGQPVYNQPVPQYSGYQQIDVSRYASGVYTAYVKRNEMVVSEQKFAKF